eukprot:3154444-Amphidinium_carterae.1
MGCPRFAKRSISAACAASEGSLEEWLLGVCCRAAVCSYSACQSRACKRRQACRVTAARDRVLISAGIGQRSFGTSSIKSQLLGCERKGSLTRGSCSVSNSRRTVRTVACRAFGRCLWVGMSHSARSPNCAQVSRADA